jgi:DNA polymerase III subunit delta'
MWSNITGQAEVVNKLRADFRISRVGHAYLFEGTDGVGKDAAAIEFAKLLNCTDLAGVDEACDKCESCKKIASFRSEYFKLICALPSGKSDDNDSDPIEKLHGPDFDLYMEQMQLKSENPYHKINLPNANNIRINSIRDLVSRIYLSGIAGSKKVFIISEADKMKQEAANALLKILEEPPKNSVIILTTSRMNSLPQTIIGRCRKVHFLPLTVDEISKKLGETADFSDKQIGLASRISFGSYSRAAKLLETGIDELRDMALKYLISILVSDTAEIVSISRNITAKNDKERTKQFLFFLNIWLRDLLRVRNLGSEDANVVNFDLLERLTKLDKNYPNADIYRIILELEEAEKLIGQNVQLALILVNLSFKLKKYFS